MIERILPAGIVCVERVGEPKSRDFETGRECAREALEKIGAGLRTVARGCSGEPLWPEGFVGSITHSHEYCAAAVARLEEAGKLGIDAEFHRTLREGVLEIIANPDELRILRRLPEGIHWDAVLFSAKESVYKAWFPAGGHLGWEDVSVMFHPDSGTFTILKPGGLEGRFVITEHLVLTAVFMAPNRALR